MSLDSRVWEFCGLQLLSHWTPSLQSSCHIDRFNLLTIAFVINKLLYIRDEAGARLFVAYVIALQGVEVRWPAIA